MASDPVDYAVWPPSAATSPPDAAALSEDTSDASSEALSEAPSEAPSEVQTEAPPSEAPSEAQPEPTPSAPSLPPREILLETPPETPPDTPPAAQSGQDSIFEGTADRAAEPSPQGPEILVEVVAPANLPEGYTFDAIYNGEVFRLEVPSGGVYAGERLRVPFVPGKKEEVAPRSKPMGKWKDSLCSCCRYGPCHSSLCCALWCQTCAMAQVMTRLKLNWLGERGHSEKQWRNTYRNVLWLTIFFYVADSLVGVFTLGTLHLAFVIYVIWVLMKTRAEVRRIHGISQGCCGSCEDCCLAYWCTCCVTAQLARQTADYDMEEARCCTDNGLAVQTGSK